MHPEPLTEPDVRLSPHTARATRRRLPPSADIARFLRFLVDIPTPPRVTRPLRSTPITGTSALLRSGPPQFPASVLSPRGVGRLCFSLVIRELVPAVPRKSLCPTHAPYTPVAVRPVIRLPADLSQEKKAPLVLTTLDTLTTRLRWVCLRSSFGHSPALSQSLELLIRRSPPRLFTAAARTGLRPAPESRSRWACHHLLRSFTIRLSVHFEPLSVPLQHNILKRELAELRVLRLLIRRSLPQLFTAAARTGLRPAPESRSRGALPHHVRSCTSRFKAY